MTSFAQSGGARIAWGERGEGPPLLLIHGLGYARWGWGPALERLAAGLRVVLLDNRGIGASDAPPGPYTVAELAADAVAVLDAAGLDRAHVLGTSLGGMVAQQLAAERPERVDRLVLVCTTAGGERAFPFPRGTVRLLEQAQSLEPAVALRRFVENALSPAAPAALVDEIVALRAANPPDAAGWAAQAAAAAAFDGFDRLGEIAAPTLVLHGTADEVVDVRNADLLAERIPDARARLVEGAGHLLFWERPDAFARDVMEFLA